MILAKVGRRILSDPVWFRAVFAQTLKAWRRHEQQVPTELASAERALADVERKITRLVDRIENGYDEPCPQGGRITSIYVPTKTVG